MMFDTNEWIDEQYHNCDNTYWQDVSTQRVLCQLLTRCRVLSQLFILLINLLSVLVYQFVSLRIEDKGKHHTNDILVG